MRLWETLCDLHAESPCKDYGEVLDILEGDYSTTEDIACWRTGFVAVEQIDRYQLIDDSDDVSGWRKVTLMRIALRQKATFPPLVLAHSTTSGDRGRYGLLDGRHRFNAAHLEKLPLIRAWVAHIGCCGGPASNQP
ncbi:hypothetical protein AB0886_13280 [Streptomyces sp. NPDC024062]|uniref:hypothetical protein n=1 Tax=unclassified Streptomyces TaxID=2593676 RepID=UPI00343D8887